MGWDWCCGIAGIELYARLRDAALPPADSLDLLTKAATELPGH